MSIANWPIAREPILRLLVIVVAAWVFAFLTNPTLPDYESYQSIFADGGAYYDWNAPFSLLVRAFSFVGLNYILFRTIIIIIAVVVFFRIAERPLGNFKDRQNTLVFYATYAILISTYILEFYTVRLRGGLSCLLFALAFAPELINSSQSRGIALRLVQLALLVASFVFHTSTFVAIFLFCVPPLLFVKYADGWVRHVKVLYPVVLVLFWIFLFYKVVSTAPDRGEHLFSPLNPARFFALSAVPLALFIVFDLPANRANSQIRHGLDLFPLLFSVSYLIAAVVLAGFFYTGNLETAGEAVVRIMTLSSLPAVFVVARWGVGYSRAVPTYLLICNGLFFINTVYL